MPAWRNRCVPRFTCSTISRWTTQVRCATNTVASGAKVVREAALVVEVLSEPTAEIDRREKLVAYQELPGLRAYWIVRQDEQRIEVHERDAAGRGCPARES